MHTCVKFLSACIRACGHQFAIVLLFVTILSLVLYFAVCLP